jgi:DNA-binding CsgD family transcriptional regulator
LDADGNIAELFRVAPHLAPSIAKLTVPAYVVDASGMIVWLNAAALDHFGDLRHKRTVQVVAPADVALARREFTAKMLGTVETTDATIHLRTTDGRQVEVDISSTQLVGADGAVVGVFGLAEPLETSVDIPAADSPRLTPRQMEVLRELAAGRSTAQIAERLGISKLTVRNHVRGVTQRLGVHSRLEAVLRASEAGLV